MLGCRALAISSILPQHLSAGCHTHITMGHSVPRRVPAPAHLPLQYIQLYPARARGQWLCSGPVQAEGRGRAVVGHAAPAPTCQAGRTFSMSFRLIPSPSSSFPFPHLGQKRHNGIERIAHSSIVSQPRKSNDDQERPCPALLKAAESACTAWRKRHPPTSGLGTQTFLEDKGLDAGKNVGPGGGVEALS